MDKKTFKFNGATFTTSEVTRTEPNGNYTETFDVEGKKVVAFNKYVGATKHVTFYINLNGGIRKFYSLGSLVPAVLGAKQDEVSKESAT